MKQLEIKTNKRLLIVESENFDDRQLDEKHKITLFHNGNILKFICKDSDLSEDIAKGLVDLHENGYYKDYLNDNNFFTLPSKSFISAIQSKNHHWGENPYEKELDSCNAYTDMFTIAKRTRKYEEAQARTFNPSKCIIFEIV